MVTLVVEDGTIVDGANSFALVAEADDYQSQRGNTSWAALTSDQKKVNLIKATDYLETVYRSRAKGTLVDQDQPLFYPREDVVAEGFDVDDDEVPERLVRACIILADKARTQELLPTQEAASGEVISTSRSVGPISTSTQYASGTTRSRPSFPEVSALMRPLLRSGSGSTYR